jgi:SNF2 family DNA or RNA helicase
MNGNIRYEKGFWCVECEPHIRARLKRVFPRAPAWATKVIKISDTPENCRDLEWFLQRYPMNVPKMTMLKRQANNHRDLEIRLSDLLEHRRPAGAIDLALPPRAYQVAAADHLEIKRGLLLADDLGLGKTVSAICPMAKADNLPAVVVCPAHLPRQWEKEIHRFLPKLNVHRIRRGKPYDLIKRHGGQRDLWPDHLPDVIIISYHMLRGWADTLAKFTRYAIFDECQQLRRDGTGIAEACKLLAGKSSLRLGLSATPIYNYGSEFFYVIDTLLPDALGSREEFVREWCLPAPGGNSRLSDTEDFGSYLRREGIMLRRTREEVGRELPELTRVAHTIDCDLNVINSVASDAINLARIILSHNERFKGEKMQSAGEFDNLMRQATGIAKAPYVAEFVRMLLESGEKVVLFGWHREVYRIWMEKLRPFNPVMYTGSESPVQKNASVEAFKKGDSKLFIMSLRSGAGVDGLQDCAKVAVFGELDWSPGVHEQCMGRLHRDGQKDPVIAYYMISEEGADPIMAEVLGVKREQIEGVRNPGGELIERIETGKDSIQKLARELLERRGGKAPDEVAA